MRSDPFRYSLRTRLLGGLTDIVGFVTGPGSSLAWKCAKLEFESAWRDRFPGRSFPRDKRAAMAERDVTLQSAHDAYARDDLQ